MPDRQRTQPLVRRVRALDKDVRALGKQPLAGDRLRKVQRDTPLAVLQRVRPVGLRREPPKEQARLAHAPEQVLGRGELRQPRAPRTFMYVSRSGPAASGGRKCSLRSTMLRSSSYRSLRCALGACADASSDGARSTLRQPHTYASNTLRAPLNTRRGIENASTTAK